MTSKPIYDDTVLANLAADLGRDSQLMQTVQDLGKELLASPAMMATKELEKLRLPNNPAADVLERVREQAFGDSGQLAAERLARLHQELGGNSMSAIVQASRDLMSESTVERISRVLGEQLLGEDGANPAKKVLDVLNANYAAAFAALPDFARLLQNMPPAPPSTPPAPAAVAGESHISVSDTFTLIETAQVEVIPADGFTPEQMRLLLVSYVYVIVLLTVGAVAIDNMETTGVVTAIAGGSAHGVAKWCSGMVGKAFDKLYPQE